MPKFQGLGLYYMFTAFFYEKAVTGHGRQKRMNDAMKEWLKEHAA